MGNTPHSLLNVLTLITVAELSQGLGLMGGVREEHTTKDEMPKVFEKVTGTNGPQTTRSQEALGSCNPLRAEFAAQRLPPSVTGHHNEKITSSGQRDISINH